MHLRCVQSHPHGFTYVLQRKRRTTATLVENTAETSRSEQLIQWLQVDGALCPHSHMRYQCVRSPALRRMQRRTMGLRGKGWP